MVAYLKAGPQVRTYLDYLSSTVTAQNTSSMIAHSSKLPEKKTVKQQGRDGKEGSPDPSSNHKFIKKPPEGGSQGIRPPN